MSDPIRFDNATTVREIAYRCAGAGSGAVMRLAPNVVMPAAEIGQAVEEILCDFWPEAMAADSDSPDERLREADPVDVVAETIYNCREERDPCGDLDDRVHPGEQPRRLPLLWAEVLERGLFPADVDEAYSDARRVLAALAAADREKPDEPKEKP